MTNLVDCMEEHEIESEGYDKSVASCPYYEIASDLLAALERIQQRTDQGIKDADQHMFGTIGSLRHIKTEVDAAIAAAKGEA